MEKLTSKTENFYQSGRDQKVSEKRYEENVLLEIKWPGEGVYNDGKQSNTLAGAAHSGCCKQ